MPPIPGCPSTGHPYPEVTGAFCRVPSTSLSQSPWYSLPVHLCRFGVRSIRWSYFLEHHHSPHQSNKEELFTAFVTTSRSRNINLVPIDYGFRPRLRGRLTLRGLALRRNPWTFGESVSHTLLATHVSILTSDTSSKPHGLPLQAYGTLRYRAPNPKE